MIRRGRREGAVRAHISGRDVLMGLLRRTRCCAERVLVEREMERERTGV